MKNRITPKIVSDFYSLVVYKSLKKRDIKILEPSVGEGILLDNIITDVFKSCFNIQKIVSVELNKEKCDISKNKGYGAIHGDFLNISFNEKFDLILACPPFINNVDVKHIMKMYDLLEDDGLILTLTTPYWVTNNEEHQVEFRKFLEGKNYELRMLPDMTFYEKNKTVPTAVLIIRK